MTQANVRTATAKPLKSNVFADFGDMDDSVPLDAASAQTAWIVFGGLTLVLVVAYLDMLRFTSSFWAMDMYSHGYIVPAFAAYLFYILRKPLMQAETKERWLGVGLLTACLAIRTWASYYDYSNPDRASFLGCLLAVCLIVGGVKMLKWAWPAVLFLALMFPLPSVLEQTLLMKLQLVASIISTFVLQTLGVSATRFGNTISIDTLKEPLEVAEACSGLRMLTIFGAMCFAMIMIIERPWWDKLVIFLSWIPIALASNIIRIVTTALLFLAFGQDSPWVTQLVHDWAGFLMMPIGLGLLVIELGILSRLTIPIDTDEYASFSPAPA
jgi:exosortase